MQILLKALPYYLFFFAPVAILVLVERKQRSSYPWIHVSVQVLISAILYFILIMFAKSGVHGSPLVLYVPLWAMFLLYYAFVHHHIVTEVDIQRVDRLVRIGIVSWNLLLIVSVVLLVSGL
jgi:hypothetical protein